LVIERYPAHRVIDFRYFRLDTYLGTRHSRDKATKALIYLRLRHDTTTTLIMPQSKTFPKDRYTRQRQGRAIRRTLAAISPSNSHSQQQSPLFSVLPAELRLLIYKDALSQHLDLSRPINTDSKTPLFRPGHTHYTTVSTTLLSTCRLVYYEAHAIPLRSATHHFRYLNSADWRYTGDTWLQHITSQRGAELYHLHDNVTAYDRGDFTKFLLPHLQWKRITWTVCAGSG
jgi:hypothetical protein